MGIESEMINYLNSSFRFAVFFCESGLPYLNVIQAQRSLLVATG